ncbi:MAG: MBL fold metallo-hydrolase [Saprospiraceae bacterium]|nr:MBL fold metallo-hydrolase [Saprospiraceae bacterium]
MAEVLSFTFNPFQENTYIVYDDTKNCVIFDPGCYTSEERQHLKEQILSLSLNPVRLINTHCHIDHVFGNAFVQREYGLDLEIHEGELPVLEAVPMVGQMYGIPIPDPSPAPARFIEAGELIEFGNTTLKAIFTPGHSPASLSFFCEADRFLIAGDVLFEGSIGRTDLPGGDFDTLIRSIKEQLLPLGDDVIVYPGHGGATSIQAERLTNPFLNPR